MKIKIVLFSVLFSVLLALDLSAQGNYLYPQFITGEIYYKNTAITASLNYNIFTSEILMMDNMREKRLPDITLIEYVAIGKDRFIPLSDNVFGKIIFEEDMLVLAEKYSASVSAAENVKSISRSSASKLLESGKPLPKGISIKIDSSYCFYKYRKENQIFYLPGTNVGQASRSGIVKLFSKYKDRIDSFIGENSIDFSNVEKLKLIVSFCGKFM
ncbi:MAG: hypothetical protein LBG92_12485 [Prevotellaceae bacterium]|jgi:hypothetical protein|nr:hypothetical protein [Prevotellaceae bacterium]